MNIDPSLLDKSNEGKQLDDSEISSFIEENRNSSTTKTTKTDFNVCTLWCNSIMINGRRPMDDIPPEKLNSLLAHFCIKVGKLNGEELKVTETQSRYNVVQFEVSFESTGRDSDKPEKINISLLSGYCK